MGAQLLTSTLITAVLTVALTDPPTLQLGPALAVIVLGAMATGLAFIWLYRVIALAGSVVSASVTYATPVVSTVTPPTRSMPLPWLFEPISSQAGSGLAPYSPQ